MTSRASVRSATRPCATSALPATNAQRTGGKCEKCGVDFIKYIGAVVAAKKAEADAVHERLESRSSLLKGLLWLPFNGGMSLIRYFLKRDRE